MLGVFSRLREVGVCIFQHGVLIAMAELVPDSNVLSRCGFFRLYGTFGRVLIFVGMQHDCTSV